MRVLIAAIAALSIPLAACNENTSVGNDREAQLEPAPTPAPVMNAAEALRNVATEVIKPETMTKADIQALGGRNGRCAVVLTEVAFPSFLFEREGTGAIKLNGKLIVLPRTGEGEYSDGGLTVTLRPGDEQGDAGLTAMTMIVIPPGAEDEIGYNGYIQCYNGDER